jgi:hypothetical protein
MPFLFLFLFLLHQSKKKKLQIGAANYSQNWLPNCWQKKPLIITTVLQRWVSSLSQTEQTHRRFSWSSHRLTPIFSSATPLLTFFFFFGFCVFWGLVLDCSWMDQCNAAFCHKYV